MYTEHANAQATPAYQPQVDRPATDQQCGRLGHLQARQTTHNTHQRALRWLEQREQERNNNG